MSKAKRLDRSGGECLKRENIKKLEYIVVGKQASKFAQKFRMGCLSLKMI